jgi:hypothetical protein
MCATGILADGHWSLAGQDMRPEPLEERRKRLAKLLAHSNNALRDGIQLSEAITGDGATIFRHACWMDLEGIVSKAHRGRVHGSRRRTRSEASYSSLWYGLRTGIYFASICYGGSGELFP